MRADRGAPDATPDVDEIIDIDAPYERHRLAPLRSVTPRRNSPWRLPGLLAAGVLAVIAVVALADYRPGPAPSPPPVAAATATPLATPSTPAPADTSSPGETLSPYWPAQIGLPVTTVPVGRVLVMANPFGDPSLPSPTPGPSPSSGAGTGSGPFVYGFGVGSDGALPVVDLGAGRQLQVTLPLEKDQWVMAEASDQTWLAVEVADQTKSCAASMPWRLLAVRLGPDGLPAPGAGRFAELAHGVSTGQKVDGQPDCPYLNRGLPIAVAGGWVAWSSDLASSKGSAVHVARLGPGRQQDYRTAGVVVDVAVSGEAVAWLEVSDPSRLFGVAAPSGSPAPAPTWRVLEADLGDPSSPAHVVDLGQSSNVQQLGRLLLDGSSVVASVAVGDGSTVHVVLADADGVTTIDDGTQGRVCGAVGAVAGTVVLTCQWQAIMVTEDGQPQPLAMPVVWTKSGGMRAVAIGDDPPTGPWPISVLPDWLILYGQAELKAIPMSALAGP